MRMRLAVGLVLILAMAALVYADGGDSGAYMLVRSDDRGELERGEWRVVELYSRGNESNKETLKQRDMRMVFRSGGMHTVAFGKEEGRSREMTVTLGLDNTPRQIEWSTTATRKNLGIYKLEGDTLTIAIGPMRPTDFSHDKKWIVYVLKRVQP